MENLFCLMILYIVYVCLSFWLFNGNFLSPSFMFCLSIAGMLCLAYYAATTMGMLFAIGIETFSIFAFSGFLFIATELCVYLLRTSTCELKPVIDEVKREPLTISRQTEILITCFFMLSLMLMVYSMRASTSPGSWSDRMREYKNLIYTNPGRIRYMFITSQVYKINLIIMNVLGYIMVYNLTVCNVPFKEVMSYMVDAACFMVTSAVFNGTRQASVEVILYLIMVYITLNMRPGGKKKIYTFMFKMIPVPVIIAAVFTASGALVGRGQNTKDPFVNVVEYICGGLHHFNHHINDPHTLYFGQSTFSFAYNVILPRIGIPYDFVNKNYGEFDIYGNTITIFGRWYQDFGAKGVFVMTFLVSLCYSLVFYYKIIYSCNMKSENHLSKILYCQFFMPIIWAFFDDRIASLFSVQTIILLTLIPFFFWLLITKKCKLF